ncbi:MAG: Ig-like domain-containing protein [Vicinamibacterales bacterium]
MIRYRHAAAGLVLAFLCVAAVSTQPPTRRGTTIAALRNYAGFYHQQTVSVLGDISRRGEQTFVGTEEGRIRILVRELPKDDRAEVRGTFLDIGRMPQDDPRLIPFNLLESVRVTYQDRWPRPGEELVLVVASTTEPPPATNINTPPLRTLAMDPVRFVGQRLTVLGQFRGRNLFGELPEAPVSDKWSFVLRASDSAVWVMGVQPKGRTFNFDPGRRIDTGRWVKVTGTARSAKGLTWLEGTSIELAQEPVESAVEVVLPPPPPPAVEVLFSAPTEGETDVRLDTRIRVQLSRDLDEASLRGRVRITYSRSDSGDRGEPQPPAIEFTASYARDNRALEIRTIGPWERFRQVKVEFLDGVKGIDGGALAPFTLTFTTGGS